jgi:hypothetical protein
MSTPVVLLYIEKAFDTTWHPGFMYKLSEFEFLTSLNKPISLFLSQRKYRVLVECEMSTPRKMKAGVPQDSVLVSTLYNLYINDALQTICVYLALFSDDISLYATERKEGYVLRKLQRCLNSMAAWCELWNIKINEDKNRASTSLIELV